MDTARRAVKRRRLDHVVVNGPAYPLSLYQWCSMTPAVASEAEAVWDLVETHRTVYANAAKKPEYTYFRLDNFSIYRPTGHTNTDRHGSELVALNQLLRHYDGCAHFLVDGILSCGRKQHHVRGIPFSTLAIDGYGDTDSFDLGDKICIQSREAGLRDVWYQLSTPASEYRRFYKPFLWLTLFTKCFVEYLLETEYVTIRHFARDARFSRWLQARYGTHTKFEAWHGEAGLREYQTTVAGNVYFLHKECYSIDPTLRDQPIWGEVDPVNLTAIPPQMNIEKQTIVTPFAYDCFRHIYFASQLKQLPISDPFVCTEVKRRKEQLKLTPFGTLGQCEVVSRIPESMPPEDAALRSWLSSMVSKNVHKGDVIMVEADTSGPWRTSTESWYAYVQTARKDDKGKALLDVLWLYRPRDTTLGAAYYPFSSELFLSDNCSCGREAVPVEAVVAKVDVKWYTTDPAAASGLFVRQKFHTVPEEDNYGFETLKESDFRCSCGTNVTSWEECISRYAVGDTVLVLHLEKSSDARTGSQYDGGEDSSDDNGSDSSYDSSGESDAPGQLEPAQVIAFDDRSRRVVLRRLARKVQNDAQAQPSELVLSDETYNVRPTRIIRKCHVRFFGLKEIRQKRIPAPYDRDGAGDCYYIARDTEERCRSTSGGTSTGSATENTAEGIWPALIQGWDPTAPMQKLRGLGIFCGGGNLDRGLEDGGAVEFDYAVDWAEHALNSYRASSRNPHAQYFLGSVNDYLAAAIAGSTDSNVARIGAVGLLAAGSPCPGFSALQTNKLSEESLRNASMVASVVAYVDLYNPEYFILENVVTMTQGMGTGKDENVFSQILAALVALGYQVQQFLMDAWSYGSCQQRSRVFIIASAPGLHPLPVPPHSHDHPGNMPLMNRNLGRSSNGLSFGKRRNDFAPFQHVSVAEACKDLPDIADAQPQLCPAFPDHRTPTVESRASRTRIAMVPIHPEGMGLVQAVRSGFITSGEPMEYFTSLGCLQLTDKSTTYARLYADRLIPTLTTALRIRDGFAGRTLHWREHRSITIMECRRAQGNRDDEVLVGTPSQQMKIIGNSVDRKVSLALGMSLREAWTEREAKSDGKASSQDR